VLHHAIEKNRKELVKALIEHGADVNVKYSVGRQPLHEKQIRVPDRETSDQVKEVLEKG